MTATASVTWADTTPPTVNVPANFTVEATGPNGAVAIFSVSATDPDDTPGVATCDHHSGDTFPLGTTKVNVSPPISTATRPREFQHHGAGHDPAGDHNTRQPDGRRDRPERRRGHVQRLGHRRGRRHRPGQLQPGVRLDVPARGDDSLLLVDRRTRQRGERQFHRHRAG